MSNGLKMSLYKWGILSILYYYFLKKELPAFVSIKAMNKQYPLNINNNKTIETKIEKTCKTNVRTQLSTDVSLVMDHDFFTCQVQNRL